MLQNYGLARPLILLRTGVICYVCRPLGRALNGIALVMFSHSNTLALGHTLKYNYILLVEIFYDDWPPGFIPVCIQVLSREGKETGQQANR